MLNNEDFDIGTDAHPYQIKKLFRNCWIIGRRFRLAHVKFGPKTIEVATFRRIVPESETPAGEQEDGEVWTGPFELFAQTGFTVVKESGRRVVVALELSPRAAGSGVLGRYLDGR